MNVLYGSLETVQEQFVTPPRARLSCGREGSIDVKATRLEMNRYDGRVCIESEEGGIETGNPTFLLVFPFFATPSSRRFFDINIALRKIVCLLRPDKEIIQNSNRMVIRTLTTFRNYVMDFPLDEEFEEDLSAVDGRKCRTILGDIYSPNYPNPYPKSNFTEWKLQVPKGYRLQLVFNHFDLEPSYRCLFDYVQVMHNDEVLGSFCGREDSMSGIHPGNQRIFSPDNTLKIIFKSDDFQEEAHQGFHAHYQIMALCNAENSLETEGVIMSPGYPKLYPPNISCNYSLRLEKGFILIITFLDIFEVGTFSGRSCESDHLQNGKVISEFFSSCQNNGTWQRPLPQCQAVDCGEPDDVDNAIKNFNETTFKASVTYQCKEYYKMENSTESVAHCEADGLWKISDLTNELPQCIPVCGKSNFAAYVPRIFGGRRANEGNFPWQVFFIGPRGGGALISDQWVLTAANMVEKDTLEMYAGRINAYGPEGVELHVAEKIIHPNYHFSSTDIHYNYDNDIALIKLDQKVKLGPQISPICLPKNKQSDELQNGELGLIAGWGMKENRRLAQYLLYTEIPVVNMDFCKNVIPNDSGINPENFIFTENMFCAGTSGRDSCQGDAGGAFAVPDRNTGDYHIEGIISWGFECGSYGVYTKVANYLEWIKNITTQY
ncbi:C1S protein, partial [Polypterus senegalus]